MKSFSGLVFALLLCSTAAQVKYDFPQTKQLYNINSTEDVFSPEMGKLPGRYSQENWQRAIDSIWGNGLSTSNKLIVFDRFWQAIDTSFACFHNLNLNWDSIKSVYRPQIAAGVSRGRFNAILNHLALLLKESHTSAFDLAVDITPLLPGTPLFVIGGWYENDHFGAGLTPLPDSTLLVYDVVPSHPLGLQRGDKVLGYDRIPWRILVREIMEFQLPISNFNSIWGSSPSAFNHSLLMSAGMNWHLFDTIDVVKCNTGDTLHLSVSPLIGQNMSIYCTEQMDIPGIPKPDYYNGNFVSYGTVNGTNIGYIYVWAWDTSTEMDFYNAVQALMQTQGLIIDFRFNAGGYLPVSNPGLSLLFDTTVSTVDFGKRCSPSNHQLMCPDNTPFLYNIPGSPPGYNKPIAVLTGPGAVSSGDQVALRMKYHPTARIFGKSTAAAFNHPTSWLTVYSGYYMRYAESDAYELNNPGVYLTHEEFEVDQNVWLSKELVCQGRDDVVEAALNWIDSSTIGINTYSSAIPHTFELNQNYPNPFNPVTKIKFDVPKMDIIAGTSNEQVVTLRIYDILGREVVTLVNDKLDPGTYEVDWNGSNVSSGLYFYKMDANGFSATKKMVLIK